jgi:hypothetical protein
MSRVTVTSVILTAGAESDCSQLDHATLGEEGDKVEENVAERSDNRMGKAVAPLAPGLIDARDC